MKNQGSWSQLPWSRLRKEILASLFAVALHEAGHAVLAWLFDRRIVRVSIIANGDTRGHVALPWPRINPVWAPKRFRRAVFRHSMITLGGWAAESYQWPELHPPLEGSDARYFERGTDWLWPGATATQIRQQRKLLCNSAVELVGKRWPAVLAVAEALLKERQLSGARVTAIIRAAMEKQARDPGP